MAKLRQISDRFWYDPYIAEELTEPDEKLLFVYLLTNQYISITGIYEIALRTINFDTNIPTARIKQIIAKLSEANKVHYESGYVIVTNYHKHVSYNNSSVCKFVKEQLHALPVTITEKYQDTINSIHALTMPTPCPPPSHPIATPCPPPSHPIATPCPPRDQPSSSSPISNTNTNSNSRPPLTPPRGETSETENSNKREKGQAGKKEKLAEGVFMTKPEQAEFIERYGNDMFLRIPDEVSEWSKVHGEIKDGFKLCCKFADQAMKKGGKNG